MEMMKAEFAEAIELQRRGNWAAAEKAYLDLLRRGGANPDAEHMLALTLHAQGRSADALPWFERAAQKQADPRLWVNHSAALLAQGRAFEASDLCRRAIQVKPDYFGAWLNLGLAGEIERDFDGAIAALSKALAIIPDHLVALRTLARCRLRRGSPSAALQTLMRVAQGVDHEIDLIRCEAWIESGEMASAVAVLQELAAKDASRIPALLLQAGIDKHKHSDHAYGLFEQVLVLDPENREAHLGVASLDLSQGESERGLQRLHAWLDSHPDDWEAANIYLFSCQYSRRIDAESLLAEHQRLHPAPASVPAWPNGWQRRTHKLRIGWLSAHDASGLLGVFFENVRRELLAQSPDIEHIFYALRDPASRGGAHLAWARECTYVGGLSDRQLNERIRTDGVDILVDLVGHAGDNRLPVLAARAAPVQVAWFDAFYPSGLDTMDYLITDPYLSPVGADAHFSEKLLRLPHGRLVYSPPQARMPDMERLGGKTFVSLNRFAKLNAEVIDVWAAILRELPDWRLHLKAKDGDDAGLAAKFRARFAQHGVVPARIEIEGMSAYAEAMRIYKESAIALDPFPYSGCATTYDALWMGLPVVTWPRDTLASRQSAALLDALGETDWIAHDAESYVGKAVALAHNEAARRDWRASARERIRPVLCDVRRFTGEMLAALRSVAAKGP
jgi:predicted O-linked N-acetylglucosamine transferase (SPINDLY family)